MLSSRYLHLHEALGLGPMWLNRGVKVLPAETESHQATAVPAPPAAAQTVTAQPVQVEAPDSHPVTSAEAQNARRAAIAAVGAATASVPEHASTGNTENRPSEKTTAPPAVTPATDSPANEAEALKQSLAGTVLPAQIMVVSICPAPEDSANGRLFSGPVGILLDNMLAAIGLKTNDAHKTSWVHDTLDFSPNPDAAQINAALPRMQAELSLSQAKAVLLLGQIFEKTEHGQTIHALCGDTPYFIIPHPARLLRQPHLKAQAWQQLKKLRQALQ